MTADELLAILDTFPWEEYSASLGPQIDAVYRDLLVIGGQQGASALGNLAFNTEDPFLSRFATKYVGERIVQLNATTKEAVASVIRQAFADNDGADIQTLTQKVADAVGETFEDYERWRALRIARTESAIALNHGNALGFAQHGVKEVDIRDGTGDPECAKANGQRWTLRQWLADPIAHPNCERSASAVEPPEEEARRRGLEVHNPQGPDGRFTVGKGGVGGGSSARPGAKPLSEQPALAQATISIDRKLAADERSAANQYIVTAHSRWNLAMREGRLDDPADDALSSDDRGRIAALTKASREAHTLQEDTVLYRGMPGGSWPKTDGAAFDDRAFVSLTGSKEVAEHFGRPYDGNVVVQVQLPRGTKLLNMNIAADSANESEYLLGPNQSFRVVSGAEGQFTVRVVTDETFARIGTVVETLNGDASGDDDLARVCAVVSELVSLSDDPHDRGFEC